MKVNQLHRDRKPRGEGPTAAGSERRQSSRQRAATPQARQAERVEDAKPGREFQGTGVPNKARRFGSSTRPEQLGGSPEAAGGDADADRGESQAPREPQGPQK